MKKSRSAKKKKSKKNRNIKKTRKTKKTIKKRKKTLSKLKKVKKFSKKTKKKTPLKIKKITPEKKSVIQVKEEPIEKKKIKNTVNRKDKKEIITLFSDAYTRKVMISLGGENALEIIRNYPNGMSDEEIARKLKVKISDVRSTLNRMHGEGFVVYSRKKDSETGWYSYSWSLNKKNIVGWANRINNEKEKMFDSKDEKYYCKKCGLDSLVNFTDGMQNEFKCSCCNKPLEYLEKDKTDQFFEKLMPEQIIRRRTS